MGEESKMRFNAVTRLVKSQVELTIATQKAPRAVLVRGGWHVPGDKDEIEEYCIQISSEWPAVRLVGKLNRHNEPETAVVEFLDFGEKWSVFRWATINEITALLAYAQRFLGNAQGRVRGKTHTNGAKDV